MKNEHENVEQKNIKKRLKGASNGQTATNESHISTGSYAGKITQNVPKIIFSEGSMVVIGGGTTKIQLPLQLFFFSILFYCDLTTAENVIMENSDL